MFLLHCWGFCGIIIATVSIILQLWVFCYIIITIVSLKLYHLFFLASCWGFCYIAELSIVVFCCKMLALLWWSWQWSLCQGFLFSFITLFFLVLRQFSSFITKFFATSFYSITSCVCYKFLYYNILCLL
jgi:hypothetical protein